MTQKSVSDLRIKILSAISDPTRLELLEYLSGGERCVCEILPAFAMNKWLGGNWHRQGGIPLLVRYFDARPKN